MDRLNVISAKMAWDITQAERNAMLVDIRSSMEFLLVGHPKGAIHIPWMDDPDWEINAPVFIKEVERLIAGSLVCDYEHPPKIILICRSGNRTEEAGSVLLEAGVENVYHVQHGFEGELNDSHQRSSCNGWRYDGLPWEQS